VFGMRVRSHSGTAALLVLIATVAALVAPVPAAAAAPPRIDLRVLVLTDGSPWVEGIRRQLDDEGVPTTVVNLADAGRPAIDGGFLADQLADGTPHAKFDGVVLPSAAATGVTAAEQTALAAFETQFGVREVDAFSFPSAAVGLGAPAFAGPMDGATATVTPAGLGDAFRYLSGPVTFEDNDPAIGESFGYLATPLPDDPATGAHFEPILTATAPGTATQGVLAGIYRKAGREQFVMSFAFNYNQQQFRLLSHGVVDWLTHGVHLGYWRNYLTVHVDDLFAADARWSAAAKCTPGEGDCPPGTPDTTPIRMTAADVSRAVTWQQQNGFTLDMLYNAAGSDQAIADTGSDALTTAMLAAKGDFRWLNHTYTHEFLGCQQDFTVIPWRCATDPGTGQPVYATRALIDSEIEKNIAWATANGVTIRANELVGGEHSGTKILPQQPDDNPNFVASLSAHTMAWLGMDASREPEQRAVGSALGVPRHPINIFYNVANPDEEVSEYNWIYTSVADGGSGICTAQPETTTCITPIDPATGFDGHIVPEQVQIMLGYMLTNDPRPFYVHQSNLAEGGLLYPVLSAVLGAYRSKYAGSAPVVEQTLTDAGGVLKNQASWTQARTAGTVSAFRQGGVVTVSGPPGTVVPITVPAGTVLGAAGGSAFGASYGGEQSAYQTLDGSALTLALPAGAAGPQNVAPAPQPEPATPAVPVPANDRSGAERSVTADAAQDSAPQTLLVPAAAGPGSDR
jgi:hypothetical protein